MKQIFHLLVVLSCLGSFSACRNTNIENLDLERSESELVAFDRENQYQGAYPGSVVFLGGAVIRQWGNLKTDFQGMPVVNRGFGEATLREIIHYYRRLLDPFQAELIVMNAGEHDITLGASAQQVLDSFREFLQQIAISNRASRIVYVSIIPFPGQWEHWAQAQQANSLIQELAATNPQLEFIDVSGEFLGSDGQPIQQLYLEGGLDLNGAGYARLRTALEPVLSKMF